MIPEVSGKNKHTTAAIMLNAANAIAVPRSPDLFVIRKGAQKPPNSDIIPATECPVARRFVGNSSGADTCSSKSKILIYS
jgi:hypothetical protein